jgi:hypothetical protein
MEHSVPCSWLRVLLLALPISVNFGLPSNFLTSALSIAILLQSWIFCFHTSALTSPPIFHSVHQTSLLKLLSILLFVSPFFLYCCFQNSQPIIFSVLFCVQLHLRVWSANQFSHCFLLPSSHLVVIRPCVFHVTWLLLVQSVNNTYYA